MIDVTKERGHPVYLQIREQLERRIASGSLKAGDPLPSVRVLAESLMVNPNTVVRAYRELEAAGLVESRQGEGTFVSRHLERARPAERLLLEHADEYAKAARELGAGLSDAQMALERAWK